MTAFHSVVSGLSGPMAFPRWKHRRLTLCIAGIVAAIVLWFVGEHWAPISRIRPGFIAVSVAGVAAALYGGFESACFAVILDSLAIFVWLRLPISYDQPTKVISLEVGILFVSMILAWTGLAR